MEIRRENDANGPVITGFSGRGFRVRDTVFPAGLMLTPTQALPWGAGFEPADLTARLTPDMLGAALDITPTPEFLLLGTGGTLVPPPAGFIAALAARDIGVEAMDSRAAARAWGILRAEERWIAAALMPL